MKNYCAFSKNHSCPLWTDYELTCYELEEANSLCHGNWIEIERQYKYIQTLQKILSDNDIPYPNEYDFLREPWSWDSKNFVKLLLYKIFAQKPSGMPGEQEHHISSVPFFFS